MFIRTDKFILFLEGKDLRVVFAYVFYFMEGKNKTCVFMDFLSSFFFFFMSAFLIVSSHVPYLNSLKSNVVIVVCYEEKFLRE